MPIDKLPDDALLEIFDFYVIVQETSISKEALEAWQSLVHVCRKWRTVVFGSPRRLNLRLDCLTKTRTPLRDTLDIWPALPLRIRGTAYETEELDNIIAVLERSDRVYHIDISTRHLGDVSAAMQKPFPELTHVYMDLSPSDAATIVPDLFLGGSAPRLQVVSLKGISFPGLPKLLLSASRLINLHLHDIPHSGYFSPKSIVTALSTLVSLRTLKLGFQSPQYFPDEESRRRPPPLTRSVLRVLKKLTFKGVSEYLEDLVARIDTPQLSFLDITLFNQIVFDTPQFIQFINRTPTLKALEEASLTFTNFAVEIVLSSSNGSGYVFVDVKVLCRDSDWQVSSLEQVCTSCLPPLFALEDLCIYESGKSPPEWRDNIENSLWLALLYPFSAVKNLYLSEEFGPRIAPALQEGGTTEVLPTLQNIFLEGLQSSGPA